MVTIFFSVSLWTRIDLVSDINGRMKGNRFGETSFCKLMTDISSSYGFDSSHSHVNCYSEAESCCLDTSNSAIFVRTWPGPIVI